MVKGGQAATKNLFLPVLLCYAQKFKQLNKEWIMSIIQPLFNLPGIDLHKLSKAERIILEAELFERICEELKEIIRQQKKDYFHLMKFNIEKENTMIEISFIRVIINDILLTEEYNLSGIAYYTNTPEDIIIDITTGRNTNPSLFLSIKIIALHRSVRPNLYKEIVKKILREQSEMVDGYKVRPMAE